MYKTNKIYETLVMYRYKICFIKPCTLKCTLTCTTIDIFKKIYLHIWHMLKWYHFTDINKVLRSKTTQAHPNRSLQLTSPSMRYSLNSNKMTKSSYNHIQPPSRRLSFETFTTDTMFYKHPSKKSTIKHISLFKIS